MQTLQCVSSSPLPFVTASLSHHFPSSLLPFVTTSLRHHFPKSPLRFLTTSQSHHFPKSPLPFVTTSQSHHHFPSSPISSSPLPCIAFYFFVMYCYTEPPFIAFYSFVMYCYTEPPFIALSFCDVLSPLHHPSSMSSLTILFVCNSEDCFPTSFDNIA